MGPQRGEEGGKEEWKERGKERRGRKGGGGERSKVGEKIEGMIGSGEEGKKNIADGGDGGREGGSEGEEKWRRKQKETEEERSGYLLQGVNETAETTERVAGRRVERVVAGTDCTANSQTQHQCVRRVGTVSAKGASRQHCCFFQWIS